jgi:regulatory protein
LSPRGREKSRAAAPGGQGTDARREALNLLSYRARSTKELEEKLQAKGFDSYEIKRTVHWLTDAGYLNDEVFARERASSRLRIRNWGTVKIAFDLKTKGISPEIIKKVLSEVDEGQEKQAAQKALEKWSRKYRAKIEKGGKELTLKAMRHLMGKGFKTSVISSAIKDFSKIKR